MNNPGSFFPTDWTQITLDGYAELFSKTKFDSATANEWYPIWNWLLNSLIVSIVGTVIYLLLAACNTFQIACSIFFQSLGKTKKSIICSLSRQILFLVPSILILSKLFGINGLLWACPVADLLAFIITGILFIYEYKHLKEHRKGINL
jgi:Na+-driven multidrug efflux pump